MNAQAVAVIVAGAITVIGTLAAQYFGRRATSKQLDQTLGEQRTRTLNERFATAADQLGSDKPAVRLSGVYAMAGLADDWQDHRQTCVDVLCAYLRMPYEPEPYPGADTPTEERRAVQAGPGDDPGLQKRLAFQASREVRHTVIRVITAHLNGTAPVSWCGLNFDFTGVVFDGGDFIGAEFSGGTVRFVGATFSGGTVDFSAAGFSGGTVSFRGARFSGAVDFSSADFSGGVVNFSAAEFSGGTVSFSGATFSGGTVAFSRAEFSGGTVSFASAKFSGGTVRFRGAEFTGGKVNFAGAKFSSGMVSFVSAVFADGTVAFNSAKFSGGEVGFRGATFSGGTVSFGRGMFSGGAKFSGGTVDFRGATFSGGTVDFSDAEFSGGEVNFSDPHDWSHPPALERVFDRTGPPPGVTLPGPARPSPDAEARPS